MIQSNVTQMVRRTYKGVRDADEAMAVVRNAMYGHELDILSTRVGVSQSCLYAIRAGRTKWPRHGTFFALIDALDLEMVLRHR
jgi:hypothetical protein